MTDITNTYGLLLRIANRYGNEYLIAELVRREGDHHAPRNISDGNFIADARPRHLEGLALEGLRLEGWMTDYGTPEYLAHESPRFYDLHAADEYLVTRMLKTLQRINKRIKADDARFAVDVFSSFAAALKLSFVVECRDDNSHSSYDNNRWNWMTVGEGRNRYRQLIDKLTAAKQQAA